MKITLTAGKVQLLAGIAISMALSTSAFAQNCTTTTTGPGAPLFGGQLATAAAAGGAASGSFAGALGNLATAFLSQQGSAFVSAPGDPKPDQAGGGVWARRSVARSPTSSPRMPRARSMRRLCRCSIPTPLRIAPAASRRPLRDPGRAGYFPPERRRLEPPSRHHGRLSRFAGDRQRRRNDRLRSALHRHLSVATYGRFFADIMRPQGVLQRQYHQPAVRPFNQRDRRGRRLGLDIGRL